MRVGSLFAGIGGFDLGFERAGMETVWQVELDAKCRELLAVRFPRARQYEDVRQCGAANLAPVDVVCGGFPCQDLSVAGKRAGLAGERSGLFYEMTRIVDELKPAWLVWENVPGLLSSHRGSDFASVLVELERIGYSGCWSTLDARYFGVAQRRRRIFGVFARGDSGAEHAASVLALAARLRGNPAPGRAEGKDVAGPLGTGASAGGGHRQGLDSAGAHVPCFVGQAMSAKWAKGSSGPAGDEHHNLIANTVRAADGHHGRSSPRGDGSDNIVPVAFNWQNGGGYGEAHDGLGITENGTGPLSSSQVQAVAEAGVRRLTPTECERLQGFPDGWTEGFADTHRYRMLGNAVAVPCAAWIGRRLLSAMRQALERVQ